MSINDNITPDSGLHDPDSPYFDPTLNAEWVESATIRAYNTTAASDMDRRTEESLPEGWALLGLFLSGNDAAQSLCLPESIGQTLAEMDEADGIEPDKDWKRSGEGYLRSLVLPATRNAPARHGLGSATVHFYRDVSPVASAFENPLDGGTEFFPVISWSEASTEGVVGQTLTRLLGSERTRGMIGFAQVYLPVSARRVPARRVNGRIIDAHWDGSLFPVNPDNSASGHWESGADMKGIVRIYHDTDTLESEIRAVRHAITLIRTAESRTANEADILPTYEEPRAPRTP